jgi:hypothetical protein
MELGEKMAKVNAFETRLFMCFPAVIPGEKMGSTRTISGSKVSIRVQILLKMAVNSSGVQHRKAQVVMNRIAWGALHNPGFSKDTENMWFERS